MKSTTLKSVSGWNSSTVFSASFLTASKTPFCTMEEEESTRITIDRAAIFCPRNSISPQPSPPLGALPSPPSPREKERLSPIVGPSRSLAGEGFASSGSGSRSAPVSHLAAILRFFAMLRP